MKSTTVLGVVPDEEQAKTIVSDLREHGFSVDDILILSPGNDANRELALDQHDDVPQSVAKGATVGGLVGGGLGWLVGFSSLAVPGMGLVLAAGPMSAALGGAAAGLVTGGLAGALMGIGMSEDEEEPFEGRFQDGDFLVSVHADDRGEILRARKILEHGGAQHVYYNGDTDHDRLNS